MAVSKKICTTMMVYMNLSCIHVTAANLLQFPLIPHHAVVEENRRKILEGSNGSNIAKQQIDSLFQGYGTHYIDLWVGTPPQRQTVIVGTGSPQTGFPCAKCTDCGELYHTDARFDENLSSTYRKKSNCDDCTYGKCSESELSSSSSQECMMNALYTEGSAWVGVESIDVTYAGGPHSRLQKLPSTFTDGDADDADPLRAKNFAFNHTFACIEATSGLFYSQMADGIMGMDNKPESFWRQAYDQNIIDKKAFALCLSRKTAPLKSGTEAGALTMGGYDERLHTSPMVYSKLDPSDQFHLTLKKIYLRAGGGGDSVLATNQNPGLAVRALDVDESIYQSYKTVLIDSGTTDTYFPRGFGFAFKRLWEELAGRNYHHERMFITEEEMNKLPTILLQFEGNVELNKYIGVSENGNERVQVDPSKVPGLAGDLDPMNPYDIIIAIPPSHYMQRDESFSTRSAYAAQFYVDEYGYDAVIGANTMMGHDVLFDVEEGALGFAESHCDYTKLEEEVAEEEKNGGGGGQGNGMGESGNTAKQPYVPKDAGVDTQDFQSTEASGQGDDTVVPVEYTTKAEKSKYGPIFTVLGVLCVCVIGYVAYDRFDLKERVLRGRHGRVSTFEDTGDLELELQYVNPIV